MTDRETMQIQGSGEHPQTKRNENDPQIQSNGDHPQTQMRKIDREDMLALTRRMTLKRTSITRIAGCYMDEDGFVDGTFNTSFLKLSAEDREKNLTIARTVPFAETNVRLKRYLFPEAASGPGSLWQMLMAIRGCGLKNDALLDTFYEWMGERYQADSEYGIFLFHDRYDIPAKAADHQRLGESEQLFEYVIGAICSVSGDYEPGNVQCGFLFPSFAGGGAILQGIDIFQAEGQSCDLAGLLLR